ncbi:two-component system response regulator ResD [Desulfohalotomaculum tongense]|uniref:response regulator n=1 Tax=Desulforadius tongensis TaxID=1216062 RepID=UPI00195A5ECA|nr:two-component system response regulator ResD [Desulforadius tongensis]
MNKKQILVVDDEKKIRELIDIYLQNEGFGVHQASDGQQALDMLASGDYDLVILDLMMPGIDGWEVCRRIRQHSEIPVIMLTARGDEIDRVLGLELGADDYIVKPFSPREVVARVKAVLRRAGAVQPNKKGADNKLVFNNLTINPGAREVSVNGKQIPLTPKEFDLLYYMARSPGRAISREQLLENVWGYDYYGDLRTVDTHINRLRDKLNKTGTAQYITTVWGVGYKFEVSK